MLLSGALHQRFHIPNRIGRGDPGIVCHLGNMIGNDDAVEVNFSQHFHDFVHIHVAIIDKRLDKVR